MANKRMFSKKITESDAFLDMPSSTQNLYFHLNMDGDDDGFVGSPKKVMRMCGAKEDDFKILLAKRFIIIFENGVCVIKHWLIHNTLKNDRYHETVYIEEKKMIQVKGNKAYTDCFQNGNILETQHNITKHNITKVSKRFTPPTPLEIKDYCKQRMNQVNAEKFFDFYESKGWMVGKNKMKDWKACVRTWEAKDNQSDLGVFKNQESRGASVPSHISTDNYLKSFTKLTQKE